MGLTACGTVSFLLPLEPRLQGQSSPLLPWARPGASSGGPQRVFRCLGNFSCFLAHRRSRFLGCVGRATLVVEGGSAR